jgi:hypothetical protein
MRNVEICWSDSILEFQILGFHRLGVGDVKDPQNKSLEAGEMKNVENLESRRQFRILGFRILGVGDVKNSYYRSPEVAKCEVTK